MKTLIKKIVGKRGSQVVRRMLRLRHAKYLRAGRCNVCGKPTVFVGIHAFTLTQKKERNDLACARCGAIARNRAMAAAILDLYGGGAKSLRQLRKSAAFARLSVYNAGSVGALHDALAGLPGYVCSEYFPGVPAGSFRDGTRCEDLQALSFADATFDLALSEDVMEHVRRPKTALQEVRRVLKPGGYCVFTVPIYGAETVVRVDTTTDVDVDLLPRLYHSDALRKDGVLAYHDFGRDIVELCASQGFEARLVEYEARKDDWACADVVVAKKVAG